LTATSAGDGSFRVDGLPREGFYEFFATAPGKGCSAAVTALYDGQSGRQGVSDPSTRIELVVHDLLFERYAFVDDRGVPVNVRGHRIPYTLRGVIYDSMSVTASGTWVAMAMRVSLEIADNEVLFVALDLGSRATRQRVWDVDIPGFKRTEVRAESRPIGAWPRVQPIALAREDSERVACRVAFPDDLVATWPWADERDQIPFRIDAVLDPGGVFVLTPTQNVFYAHRSAAATLKLSGAWILEYEVVRTSGEWELRPAYPPLAYADFYYRSPDVPGPRLASAFVGGLETRDGPPIGRIMWPGYRRIGPVPEGSYRFYRKWWGPRHEKEFLGPTELSTGLNVVRWE